MNYKFSEIAGSLILLVLSSSTVWAGTVKENHAGAKCVRYAGGTIAYDSHGAVFNSSTTTRAFVVCPIPHTDFDGYFKSGEIDGGWFRAVDLNDSSNIRCRFKSRGINNSGSYYSRSGSIGSTAGFGTHTIHINLKGVGEHWHTHYVLGCELPPRQHHGDSKLFTYQVRE